MKKRRVGIQVLACLMLGLVTTWVVAAVLSFLDPLGGRIAETHLYCRQAEPPSRSLEISLSRCVRRGLVRQSCLPVPVGAFVTDPYMHLRWGRPDAHIPNLTERDLLPLQWGSVRDVKKAWPPIESWVMDDARGWPRVAFWSTIRRESQPPHNWAADGGLVYLMPGASADEIRRVRAIPFRPIWSAVLVDTAVFALLWMSLLFGAPIARAAWRQRLGRCPRCGYDLSGVKDDGCPECGWGRS